MSRDSKEGDVMGKTYEASELGDMLIYQNEKGDTKVDVYFCEQDVWMSQAAIARMYNTTPQNITMHIKNIYEDGELVEEATCKEFLQVQTEGTRQIKRNKKHYNFRMILAIGYRVRSNVGIHFRNWASNVLEEYTRKGFAMNDERLKNPKQFGEDYFDELLERIRDIRASEKRFYQKIWKEEAFGSANNAVACHVHNLRGKIGRILPEGCFVIRCVREVGCCFETDL